MTCLPLPLFPLPPTTLYPCVTGTPCLLTLLSSLPPSHQFPTTGRVRVTHWCLTIPGQVACMQLLSSQATWTLPATPLWVIVSPAGLRPKLAAPCGTEGTHGFDQTSSQPPPSTVTHRALGAEKLESSDPAPCSKVGLTPSHIRSQPSVGQPPGVPPFPLLLA
jgi:hypothetical protein